MARGAALPRSDGAHTLPLTGDARARGRAGELVRIAAQMFYEQGYDATSLQDVADQMGMLKGSLYYYIKSKDDLLYTVILHQHQAALALAKRCAEINGTPADRLSALIRGYARSLSEERIFVSVYLRELKRLSPDRRRQIIDERQAYVDFVVDVLRAGQKAGQFRLDLDPELTAYSILGMLNSSYRWYDPDGPYDADQLVSEFETLILGGISESAVPRRRVTRRPHLKPSLRPTTF